MMSMRILSGIFLVSFMLCLLSPYAFADPDIPIHDLTVQFDLDRNSIRGVSAISLPAGRTARIDLTGVTVKTVVLRDRPLTVDPGTLSITFTPGSSADLLKIEYEAEYPDLPENGEEEDSDAIPGNHISSAGILLAGNWHPVVEGSSVYRLTAVFPSEFEGISEAEEVQVRELPDKKKEFRFTFNHPLRSLTLVAARFRVEKQRHGQADILTYFLTEDRELARRYREYAKAYLDRYETYFGTYPFRRFAVVENFLTSGLTPPTFSLLGRDVVISPDVAGVLLGREILRQWFGNLVQPDTATGDWSKGLVTYLSDHLREEAGEQGWSYRKQTLLSFRNYGAEGTDIPLSSFRGQEDRPSVETGYGKSAMVFHMLRKMTGDEMFFSSLRTFAEKNSFRAASWADIGDAFEADSGRDLDWFFRQWVEEVGIPDLEISDPELHYRGAKAVISFNVMQNGRRFRLFLPVAVKLRDGEVRKVFEIEPVPKTSVEIEIGAENTPLTLIIDDQYDLFRVLADEEVPPLISRLLRDDQKIFVIPRDKEDVSADLSEYLIQQGFTERKEGDLSYETIRSGSLLIPGFGTTAVKRLFGKLGERTDDFSLITRQNPFNKRGVIAVIDGTAETEFPLYMRLLPDFANYSDLSFQGKKNILKTVGESSRGIQSTVSEDTPGVHIPRITDLDDVIEEVAGKDIIYVGEAHDRLEHHRVQLQVIMQLFRKYGKIAIGMEMFQKSFQQAVDDYIEGRTDERTFLKKSEYFKQWGFDYNLYREILLFAKEYKIPVIALNVRKELVSKVSRKGLQALSDEELKEIPEYFDLSDNEYRERLRDFFGQHARSEERNFDFFYQAQVLWDEAMAHNLDAFMSRNPEYKVVVVAGAGHMAFGSGIPNRLFRLNKRDYAVILNAGDIEKDVADYVLFPSPASLPESPKIGVILEEKDKKMMIRQFTSDSIAEKAGMEVGDIILSLDGTPVESMDDMRISLLTMKKGDEVTVKVLRKRFLRGPAEKEIRVTL